MGRSGVSLLVCGNEEGNQPVAIIVNAPEGHFDGQCQYVTRQSTKLIPNSIQ